MDDNVARILENTEISLEDSKSIRSRVEDGERYLLSEIPFPHPFYFLFFIY
jgi:hypothetical protein